MHSRDTITDWASLGFGGKHCTKKKNYFSDKAQEKKVVSKWDFQNGKEIHIFKKNPKPQKNISQLLWLVPVDTTKISPQNLEKNVSP